MVSNPVCCCGSNGMHSLCCYPSFPVQRDRIHQEIRLLMTLDHPGVVKLVDVFVTPSHILIVTERAMGGDVSAWACVGVHGGAWGA